MSRETWYILENGATADPREVKPDAAGVLRHRDGIAVAMRGDVPRSRGVNINQLAEDVRQGMKNPAAALAGKEMRPAEPGMTYLTRETETRPAGSVKTTDTDADLAAARVEYQKVFDKRPFAGWDAPTLREKIAAKATD